VLRGSPVDVDAAALEEEAGGGHVPHVARGLERRPALAVGAVGVGAVLDEEPDEGPVAARARRVQRRLAFVVGPVMGKDLTLLNCDATCINNNTTDGKSWKIT
jgi:hypothetical protein